MDTEFANLFVQKQKEAINELMIKVLFTETKLSLVESTAEKITGERDAVIEQYHQLEAEHSKIVSEKQTVESQSAAKDVEIRELKKEVDSLTMIKSQVESLKKTIDTLSGYKDENDELKRTIETLRNVAKQKLKI